MVDNNIIYNNKLIYYFLLLMSLCVAVLTAFDFEGKIGIGWGVGIAMFFLITAIVWRKYGCQEYTFETEVCDCCEDEKCEK